MSAKFFLVYLMCVVGVVQSQGWVGSYTVQPGCDLSTCCCLDGKVTITRPTTENFHMSSNLKGSCRGITSLEEGIAYPAGYKFSTFFLGQLFDIELSMDNQAISATNKVYPQCSGKAIRNSAIQQNINSKIALMALALLSLNTYLTIN